MLASGLRPPDKELFDITFKENNNIIGLVALNKEKSRKDLETVVNTMFDQVREVLPRCWVVKKCDSIDQTLPDLRGGDSACKEKDER